MMWSEIKRLWSDFRPIITYKAKEDKFILGCMRKLDEVNKRHAWSVIQSVIFSLEKLKKNTWDVDRIECIQQWLKENFEK